MRRSDPSSEKKILHEAEDEEVAAVRAKGIAVVFGTAARKSRDGNEDVDARR
jgi:hypothetical protein